MWKCNNLLPHSLALCTQEHWKFQKATEIMLL